MIRLLVIQKYIQNLKIEKKMHPFPCKRLHLPDFTCHDILMMVMMMMINKSAVTHQLTQKIMVMNEKNVITVQCVLPAQRFIMKEKGSCQKHAGISLCLS